MLIDDVRAPHPAPPSAGRSGFTLVELLVVIAIIAMLAALITPAVMRSLNSARNAAIKAEIDMLHMALMNYKNDYGSFPPAKSTALAGSPSAKHLQRLFPRCTTVVSELGSQSLTPEIAIYVWLRGFTGDPMLPITGAGGRKRLFDFDESRVSGYRYAPANKKGSPYIYIDSASYNAVPYDIADVSTPGAQRVPATPLPTGTVQDFGTAVPVPSSPAPQPFFNADTFQILCAGQDEEFGTDDDLSNFWKSTRKDYLDSLKQ